MRHVSLFTPSHTLIILFLAILLSHAMMAKPSLLRLAFLARFSAAAAFTCPQHSSPITALNAAKKHQNKRGSGSGGGFGGSKAKSATSVTPASADVQSLERQWDNFASITDLEIFPPGNPEDEDYRHFIVADVFVRIGPDEEEEDSNPGTGWFRTGKLVAADEIDINSAFALQRGLILWTAAAMWPQLSAKGQAAAKLMQVGFLPPSMNMADETEPPLDDEEADDVQILPQRISIKGDASLKKIGFRPDFNPQGFTYKRRERSAMKVKKSGLDEIMEVN
ncbi:hypothetical protein ACHAXM_002346 [Skeletonema potamos]